MTDVQTEPEPLVAVGAGRFDAETAAVVDRLHRAAETQPVYLATEVMGYQWRAIKANLPEGWKAIHRNEYLIAWDHRVKKPIGAKAHWSFISRGVFNRGRIHIRSKVAEIRLADRDRSDDEGCYYSVAHLPAHLQDGDHYKTDPQFRDEVEAHKQALRTLGTRALRRKKRHPRRRQCLAMDVNVDLFRKAWRQHLRSELHLLPVWRWNALPKRGDMGHGEHGRLITGVWTYGFGLTKGRVTTTPEGEKGLDHRLVTARLMR